MYCLSKIRERTEVHGTVQRQVVGQGCLENTD